MSDPRSVNSGAQKFGPPTGSPVPGGLHRCPDAGDTTQAVQLPPARKSLPQTIAALLGSQVATW